MVILKPKKDWTSAKTFDELAEKMGSTLSVLPGVTFGFQYPVQMRFNELMTGARQDVVCKIYGEDLDTLAAYAHKLGELVSSVEGAKDLYVETVGGLPQIVVTHHRAALARYGLDVEAVNDVVRTAFAGSVAGQVFEGERRFDLVVRMAAHRAGQTSAMCAPFGAHAHGQGGPLSYSPMCASKMNDPAQVQREDAKRRSPWASTSAAAMCRASWRNCSRKVDAQVARWATTPPTAAPSRTVEAQEASDGGRAAGAAADPAAALLRLRLREAEPARLHRGAALRDRRRLRPGGTRHALQHLGGCGLHRVVRCGGAQRHRAHQRVRAPGERTG
jgi:multidrug efflux pump subunit AcrB